jgi:hypothetical protein
MDDDDNNPNDARATSVADDANDPSLINAANDTNDFGDDSDADADEMIHAQAEEHRQAEIRAAKRSIETNLVPMLLNLFLCRQ